MNIKKLTAALGISAALTLSLTGNALASAETDKKDQTQAEAATGSAIETLQDGMVRSYLTGEPISEEKGRRRPIAVMMNNIVDGCPQEGISSAGIVYEAPVEGDITRLMAVFEDYDDLSRIGSVRSCRDYFLFYAAEYDAIYIHYGQSVYALDYLAMGEVDNINGMDMADTAFFRVSDRVSPHNAFTDYDHIQAGIEAKGYSQEFEEADDTHDAITYHFNFADLGTETNLEKGSPATTVKLDNFGHNHPWFEYDEETGLYKRFQFGNAQVDGLTGEQLTCKNIILQYSSCPAYPDGSYLNVDSNSGGEGLFITNGKAIPVRWEKTAPWGKTLFFDENDYRINVNNGVTWIEIVQDTRLDQVTVE